MSTNTPRDALAHLTARVNEASSVPLFARLEYLDELATLLLDLLGRLVDAVERLENERTK